MRRPSFFLAIFYSMLDMAARGPAGNVTSRIDLAIQQPLDAVISQDADSVSAHLNSSIIRLVITTVLFTMSLSRTVNMQ